jgi:hypothetical protein
LIFFSSFDDKLGEFGPEKEIFFLIYIVFILDISIVRLRRGFRVLVFNATFNNISVISWQSVLLVEETRVPGENH